MPYPAPAGNTLRPSDEDMLQEAEIQVIKQHVRKSCQQARYREISYILTIRLLHYAYHNDMDLHQTQVSHKYVVR
jgi:hypothetical protein